MNRINNIEFLELLKTGKVRGQIIAFPRPNLLCNEIVDFAKNLNNQIYGYAFVHDKFYLFYRKNPSILELLKAQKEKSDDNSQNKSFCGIIDGQLNEVIPAKYTSLEQFMNDVIRVESVGKLYGLMHLSGEIILDCIYDRILPQSESLFAVCKEGKMGFMDFSGRVVIPIEYVDTGGNFRFANGLAAVAKQDSEGHVKWGYINHNNEIILPFIFSKGLPFENNTTLFNTEYEYSFLGPTLKAGYFISIDGSMVIDDDEDLFKPEPDYEGVTRYGYSGSEDDRLDAYEGDESNYWNTD